MNYLRRHTCCTDKAKDLIGKGHLGRGQQSKGTQESFFATWLRVSGLTVMGLIFQIVSGQSPYLRPCLVQLLAVGASQARWFLAQGFLGGQQYILWVGISSPLWLLPNSSSWPELFGSVFLHGTSQCEVTHVSSYNPAWPGTVSVSGSLISA